MAWHNTGFYYQTGISPTPSRETSEVWRLIQHILMLTIVDFTVASFKGNIEDKMYLALHVK